VNRVPAALTFYRGHLGFDVMFHGPEPDDIFFSIARPAAAMIMFKAVGVAAVPNYTRDVKKGIACWDAYLDVPIRTRWRQSSRHAMSSFPNHSRIPMMACVDSNSRTRTATFCFPVVLAHERQIKLGFDLARVSLGADQPAVDCESSLSLALVHGLLREDMQSRHR
jgi:hypothetical protein